MINEKKQKLLKVINNSGETKVAQVILYLKLTYKHNIFEKNTYKNILCFNGYSNTIGV
jgi:hypothetical protein